MYKIIPLFIFLIFSSFNVYAITIPYERHELPANCADFSNMGLEDKDIPVILTNVVLTKRTCINLDYNSISGRGLSMIVANKKITGISLRNNDRNLRAGDMRIFKNDDHIEFLDISFNNDNSFEKTISDADIYDIASMQKLKTFYFLQYPSDDAIGTIPTLLALVKNPSLKSLHLHYFPIDKSLALAFFQNTHLEELSISIPRLPNLQLFDQEIMLAAANNKTLKKLNMEDCFLSDDAVILLAKNTTINTLRIEGSEFTDKAAEVLAQNTTLTDLDIGSTRAIGDATAIAFSKNTTLKKLSLGKHSYYSGNNLEYITNVGAKELAENKTLVSLDLHNQRFTDEGVYALSKNETLEELAFGYENISADAITAVAQNKHLKHLDLYDANINTETVLAFYNNANLEDLSIFPNGNINPKDVTLLAKNKNLKSLFLWGFPINMETAAAFAANSTLKELTLLKSPVYDPEAFLIAKNRTLNFLDVSFNCITPLGENALHANKYIKEIFTDGEMQGDLCPSS